MKYSKTVKYQDIKSGEIRFSHLTSENEYIGFMILLDNSKNYRFVSES